MIGVYLENIDLDPLMLAFCLTQPCHVTCSNNKI